MVEPTLDPVVWLRKHLEQADTDLLREMVRTFIQALMSAEADATCGAPYGERSEERTNRRNGYRERDFDTRTGTMELQIPKLRAGSYFPDWLLERRRRAERALVQVVAECYVKGVSIRRVDGLIRTLGIEGISKSQVSSLAKSLDESAEAFRSRPLDGGPYAYVWMDALVLKCREGGRIAGVAAVIATGVNADGRREILGLDVLTTEDGAGWTAFLRSLVARGLSGVALVVSDAHEGLVGLNGAIGAVLRGASWQRCRTHFMRNVLAKVPKSTQPFVATMVRSIFAQPDQEQVALQLERVTEELADRFADASELLEQAGPDITAFASLPTEHWRQIWSNTQPAGAVEPGDPPAHRRRGHLPQPRRDHLPRRCNPCRVPRRVGRGSPLHGRGVPVESLAKACMKVIEGDGEEVRGELVATACDLAALLVQGGCENGSTSFPGPRAPGDCRPKRLLKTRMKRSAHTPR